MIINDLPSTINSLSELVIFTDDTSVIITIEDFYNYFMKS